MMGWPTDAIKAAPTYKRYMIVDVLMFVLVLLYGYDRGYSHWGWFSPLLISLFFLFELVKDLRRYQIASKYTYFTVEIRYLKDPERAPEGSIIGDSFLYLDGVLVNRESGVQIDISNT